MLIFGWVVLRCWSWWFLVLVYCLLLWLVCCLVLGFGGEYFFGVYVRLLCRFWWEVGDVFLWEVSGFCSKYWLVCYWLVLLWGRVGWGVCWCWRFVWFRGVVCVWESVVWNWNVVVVCYFVLVYFWEIWEWLSGVWENFVVFFRFYLCYWNWLSGWGGKVWCWFFCWVVCVWFLVVFVCCWLVEFWVYWGVWWYLCFWY